MTEYDYSPAAYERYLAQQARVSSWVNDTRQNAHAYSNPFVLSPALRDRSFYDQPDDSSPPSSMASSRGPRSRSRSYADHTHYDRTAPSRQRSQSHSRSTYTPRDVQVIYPPHGSQPYYPQPHAVARTPAPRVHTSPPRSYHYQTYAPQPPPGQIYQPPAPVHKDTLYRHPSQSRHASSKTPPQPYLLVQSGGPKAEYKRGPPIHAPIPVKPHGQQPLLKRLLGFVTMSPVGGRSGNGRGLRGAAY